VVTREQVRQALWPGDTFVDFDVGLNSAIKRLRDALNASAENPRSWRRCPAGHRFVAAARTSAGPPAPSALEAPPRTAPLRSEARRARGRPECAPLLGRGGAALGADGDAGRDRQMRTSAVQLASAPDPVTGVLPFDKPSPEIRIRTTSPTA